MKKYITYLTVLAAVALTSACSKDTEGMTWTVYYPAITLDGSTTLDWEAGVPFEEPGYEATYNGEDYTSQVAVTTTMDLSDPAPGLYTITYSVGSPDGYQASASRTVYVWDYSDEVAGYYTSSTDSYRDYNGTTYYGDYPVTVVGWGDGDYWVSDVFGGWYEYRNGYGSSYAMQADIHVNADNTIDILDSYIPGWASYGYEVDGWEDAVYDPDTLTLSWYVSMEGISWQVYLVKDE
ncbi:MAG: DUF5012 domain-containing protein [Bacteroidales bacterium]|nr:DUF5012 domain-containing protein [Bacteroidales bacterium]